MPITEALTISHLNKHYEKFDLKDVSFSVPKGSITGFIGRNGAGKTTTLKSIMNLVHYDKGEITALGYNMLVDELKAKQDIAFSLCEMDYYPNKSIESLTDVTSRFYKNFSYEKFNKLCELFNLDKSKKLRELSRGMKVKYSLALALSHEAKLFILDEPTSGLDPISRDEILEIFLKLVKDGEHSILFSTHITSDLDKCADHIVYINNGEMRFSGTKDEFTNAYRLIKGPLNMITPALKEIAVSFREHASDFVGLIKKEDVDKAKALGVNISIPSLEETMVYLEKGGINEEFNL